MTRRDMKPSHDPPLRETAEAQLAAQRWPAPMARTSDELLHELRVHQVELEMQNGTLRQSQIERRMEQQRPPHRYRGR